MCTDWHHYALIVSSPPSHQSPEDLGTQLASESFEGQLELGPVAADKRVDKLHLAARREAHRGR